MPEENANKQTLAPPEVESGGKHLRHETYKDELLRILCRYLEAKLSDDDRIKEDAPEALAKQVIADKKWRRWIGIATAAVGGVISLCIIITLYAVIYMYISGGLYLPASVMAGWPAVVFVSGSFLSFIVAFAVLIKGMFQHHKEEETSSPVKEALDILQKIRGEE